MAIIGMMITTSCTTEMENTEVVESNFVSDFSSAEKKSSEIGRVITDDGSVLFLEFGNKIDEYAFELKGVYEDLELRKPVQLPYFYCGGGVYTNGINTYHIVIVPLFTPGSYWQWDDFSQTGYSYTTAWGGECTGLGY